MNERTLADENAELIAQLARANAVIERVGEFASELNRRGDEWAKRGSFSVEEAFLQAADELRRTILEGNGAQHPTMSCDGNGPCASRNRHCDKCDPAEVTPIPDEPDGPCTFVDNSLIEDDEGTEMTCPACNGAVEVVRDYEGNLTWTHEPSEVAPIPDEGAREAWENAAELFANAPTDLRTLIARVRQLEAVVGDVDADEPPTDQLEWTRTGGSDINEWSLTPLAGEAMQWCVVMWDEGVWKVGLQRLPAWEFSLFTIATRPTLASAKALAESLARVLATPPTDETPTSEGEMK